MDDMIGGRYRLDKQLGAGAMAEVWLAVDTQLGREVAVKLLRGDADPARFEREARAVASLSHPNIARLYDYGEADGRPYMVFEHLPGGTLEDRLQTATPLADAETERIAAEVADGLAHAHEHDLVHRDLKPANIVFDGEGRAKISDFGIARVTGADTLTEAGTLIGTAAYMSPEQASGEPVTPASDVYSFGVILYRLLAGRLPFESTSAVDLVRRQLHEEAAPISALRPDAPRRSPRSRKSRSPRIQPDGRRTAARSSSSSPAPPRRRLSPEELRRHRCWGRLREEGSHRLRSP